MSKPNLFYSHKIAIFADKTKFMARRWTEKQEKIIIEETQATPDHIREACKRASERMDGRSPDAVVVRYYNHILKRLEQTKEEQ